jgi:hypothetical protein
MATNKQNLKHLENKILRKKLGAFYTPDLYSKKALELVRQAIKEVPIGNDYIILDRSAGIGNLEKFLNEDELSHCILSTINEDEFNELYKTFKNKVRHIFMADALSEEFIENKVIKKYIDNEKCNVILLENPPYAEINIDIQKLGKGKEFSDWKNSFVYENMKTELSKSALNELSNAFIWSAFKYYLKKKNDAYIVFAPIKYWKIQKIIAKKFKNGFAFNKKFFYTNSHACITCIHWQNIDDKSLSEFKIRAFNIENDKLVDEGIVMVKQTNSLISSLYDKRTFENDDLVGITCNFDGTEFLDKNKSRKIQRYNENIVGYLIASSNTFVNNALHSCLLNVAHYLGHGFFLRKDNFLKLLPLFSCSKYIAINNDWKNEGFLTKSADKKEIYLNDVKSGKLKSFLLKNLFWVSLTHFSHLRSFYGTDNRFYRNELCLDTTNGETIASIYLKELKFEIMENEIIDLWNKILKQVKDTKQYDNNLTYGLYQIEQEINLKDKKQKKGFYYPELNSDILLLKKYLKEYYLKEIAPILFEYEFIK